MRALLSAFRTLTIIPLPGVETDSLGRATLFFPLVGAWIGAATAGVGAAVAKVTSSWTPGAAALMVVGEIVLTGALHLDGLADTADSLGAYGDRDRALAIMKDSRVGAFGVIALICAVLLKFVTYEQLLHEPELGRMMIPAFAVSRWSMTCLCVCLPYIGTTSGTGKTFTSSAGRGHLLGATCLLALSALPAGLVGLWILLAGGVMTCLCGLAWRRRHGGITGDLLGATGELVLLTTLLAAVIAL